jgi:magnesium chelatase subunit D
MARAQAALTLLAIDPAGLKGLWLRARAGPVRDLLTAALAALPLPLRRLHPGVADDALYGGLDLAATLAQGRPVRSAGLLEGPSCLVLAMAERCPPGLAARLARRLDDPGPCLVALDEGAEPDEGLPAALADRLGLFVDLSGVVWSDAALAVPDADRLAAARARLAATHCPPEVVAGLTRAAAGLGIGSLRAPLLALAAARASAAWSGHDRPEADDLRLAAELVFGHRALPEAPADAPPPDPPAPPPPEDAPDDPPPTEAESRPEDRTIPDEILVEAARAALPPDLLAALAAGRALRAARGAGGTGAEQGGNRRGRPLPSRPGRIGSGARIDLVASLRAAAPWQRLRRAQAGRPDAVLLVRGSDIRVKRFRETSDRVLIFAVDASGSSALARLGEAKGAIELLLAQAYARRDHVALLAFRGRAAELILPPTRSLVQTKRRLAGLPGGGGTPLAAGLQLGLQLAAQARARGMTPTLALLTDGRGNIALDGSADRPAAEAEAQRLAAAIRAAGLPALVIDTATRPQPGLAALAALMGAPHVPLPRADAHRLSAVLAQALEA